MPSPFASWTYQDAIKALGVMRARVGTEQAFGANRAYAEKGDHWQDGNGWALTGTIPSEIRARVLAAVEPQFRPVDVIGEVLDNVANGLLDKEADFGFTPIGTAPDPESTEGQAQAAEIEAMISLVSSWWDRRQFWEQARKAVRRSRWATYGALKVRVTPDALVTETKDGATTTALPTNLSFAAALENVKLMAPDPEAGFVYIDPDTEQPCGVFFFEAGPANARKKFVELWFVDGEKTLLRVLEETGDASSGKSYELPIGGRLPMAQMDADLLITDAVRRQQKTLNFFETILVRVVETAGFPERYTTNAMPQGVWDRVPPASAPPLEERVVEGVTWYLHAVPRVLGPMITTDLRGIALESIADGKPASMTSPSVVKFDPTDPEYMAKASDHGRQTILRECKQGHLATDSTAEASGNAYVQARAIFGKDLRATKSPLEGMVRMIIEAAIAMAEHMSSTGTKVDGQQSKGSFLSRYRCVVDLHVDTGPPVPTEMAEYRAQYKDGMLSKESTMTNCGVEDVGAELASIEKDPLYLATLRKAQGEALDALQKGGAGFAGAAEAIGITPEEAKKLQASDTNNSDVTQ